MEPGAASIRGYCQIDGKICSTGSVLPAGSRAALIEMTVIGSRAR